MIYIGQRETVNSIIPTINEVSLLGLCIMSAENHQKEK
jgi:hypothetical protein